MSRHCSPDVKGPEYTPSESHRLCSSGSGGTKRKTSYFLSRLGLPWRRMEDCCGALRHFSLPVSITKRSAASKAVTETFSSALPPPCCRRKSTKRASIAARCKAIRHGHFERSVSGWPLLRSFAYSQQSSGCGTGMVSFVQYALFVRQYGAMYGSMEADPWTNLWNTSQTLAGLLQLKRL